MRDRHCLQCGVFIRPVPGWKNQSSRRGGGLVHDTCLDNYLKHKKIVSKIKLKIRKKIYRLNNKHKLKLWNAKYYLKNARRIRNRNYRYYHTHQEQERMRKRVSHKIKHYYTETDNEFIVKVWPKWKTQGGWII